MPLEDNLSPQSSSVWSYVNQVVCSPHDFLVMLYDDDGISYDYEHGEYQRIPMRWNNRERTLTLGTQEGHLRREQRFAVRLHGGKETREITYTGEEMTVRF